MYDVRDKAAAPVARHAVATLPVIDVSPFVEGGSAASRAYVAAEIRRACIDIGFFYVTGHGIPAAELDEALDRGRRFFAAPLADKMRVRAGKRSPGARILSADPRRHARRIRQNRRREGTFFRKPRIVARRARAGELQRGPVEMARRRRIPGFSDFFKRHIDKRMRLTRALARGFALSLDLARSHFDPAFAHLGCVLMFNCYPKRDATVQEGRWNFSPHTDYGAFTILLQDHLGGLQVRNAAGNWIDSPPVPGTFVVNIGDMFAMWTNDLYVSTLHRVMNRADAQRLSMAFFDLSARADGDTLRLRDLRRPGQPAAL